MRLVTFVILTALALLYSALSVAETAMYRTWDHALLQQRDIQAKVAYFQRLNGFIEQMLRRVAVESQHDPALAQLLKNHQIKVVTNPGGDANGALSPGNPAAPASSNDMQNPAAPHP